MNHIPTHITAQIRADIRAIAEQARTEQAARQERITTAARQAATEWDRTRGQIPDTTTAAAHIANATRHAAHRPNGTPTQPETPSE